MSELLRRALPYLLAIIVVLGVLWGAYSHGVSVTTTEWQGKWDKQALELSEAKAKAVILVREEEQRRQNEINKVTQDAEQQIAQYRTDAAAADAVAVSLREQAKRLAKRASQCPSNPNAPIGSKAATSPAMVLSELFNRCDERAGDLAKAFDQCRAAGLACERAYNSLSNTQ